jgi:putative effector of murein hydrolase LrgA (UPF0299 family)
MISLIYSIFISLGVFCWLVWMLRRSTVSVGLPIAYLFGLLLIHVPGALAHLLGGDVLGDSDLTELGISFTAIGAICFVAGVWLARLPNVEVPDYRVADRHHFSFFCLIGGWIFIYGLSFLQEIPTLGAAVHKGGAVWALGVLLGLRAATLRSDAKWAGIWLGALAVYPVLTLLLAGFVSYGTAAIIIVVSALVVSVRSHRRVAAGIVVAAVLSLNLFLNYFEHREEIRNAVWSGAPMNERINASMNIFRDFQWFNPANEIQLTSLDQRLNQNYFVGLAATRITNGLVDYLYGRSLWEGLLSLVPRILWPEKPVFGGSPRIVSEMTGLVLSETTSWGVGNVMEFYINFGIPGVVIGFLVLGWLLGMLDQKAAVAEADGDFERLFLFFLPAVALIEPSGSLVELVGGSAAALVAAYGWKWIWKQWAFRSTHRASWRDTHTDVHPERS